MSRLQSRFFLPPPDGPCIRPRGRCWRLSRCGGRHYNTISQWLFPKFFTGAENELWLGEGGILPLSGYVAVSVVYAWMRWRGLSWAALARRALESQPGEPPASVQHRP